MIVTCAETTMTTELELTKTSEQKTLDIASEDQTIFYAQTLVCVHNVMTALAPLLNSPALSWQTLGLAPYFDAPFAAMFAAHNTSPTIDVSVTHPVTIIEETLYPNAAGDNAENNPFPATTPNWDCVDETPHDSDTTYVVSLDDEDPHLDLDKIQASAIPAGSTINWLKVHAVLKSISPTYKASFRIALKKSGGSVQYSSVIGSVGTTYTDAEASFSGILQSDLALLQIGIEITSTLHIAYWKGRCTQLRVVINATTP